MGFRCVAVYLVCSALGIKWYVGCCVNSSTQRWGGVGWYVYVCVDTSTGDTLTPGPGREGVWTTGSREPTRTCQSGRARWAALLPDTLAGILPAKASACPSPSTESSTE